MARITRVKKAQQRYRQVPVLDESGQPKRVPVMDKRTGQQKTSKRGPQWMRVTRDDKDQPLPPLRCDYCPEPIEPGQPYKHVTPKSGPYGGTQRNRHDHHPDWRQWDLSSSLSARVAQIEDTFQTEVSDADDPETVRDALRTMADSIRELAEEKRESAQNIVDGFGHETSTSEELNSTADELDGWAGEVENAEVPDLPEPEEEECDSCGGTGAVEESSLESVPSGTENALECADCDGSGQVTPDEPTEDQMDTWRSEVEEATSITGECPV